MLRPDAMCASVAVPVDVVFVDVKPTAPGTRIASASECDVLEAAPTPAAAHGPKVAELADEATALVAVEVAVTWAAAGTAVSRASAATAANSLVIRVVPC